MRIVIALILLLAASSFAQKPPCREENLDLNYKFENLKMSPPMSIYKPYEVLKGYIFIDSLTHNLNYFDYLEQLEQNRLSGEILIFLYYNYVLADYNPVEYYLYTSTYDSTRTVSPYQIESETCDFINEKLGLPAVYKEIILADYILNVTINDIEYRYNPFNEINIYICTARINDVIKGKVSPGCKDITIPENSEDFILHNPYIQILKPDSSFQFTIYERHFKDREIKLNSDYIIFPSVHVTCYDSGKSIVYLNMHNDFDYEYNSIICEIKDGAVQSPSNFGIEQGLSYEKFKEKIISIRDSIFEGLITSIDKEDGNNDLPVRVIPSILNGKEELKILSQTTYEDISIRIYDQRGSIVKTFSSYSLKPGYNNLNIKDDFISSGIYYIIIQTKDRAFSFRIVVIR